MAMFMSRLARKGGPAILSLRWAQAALTAAASLLPGAVAKAQNPSCSEYPTMRSRTDWINPDRCRTTPTPGFCYSNWHNDCEVNFNMDYPNPGDPNAVKCGLPYTHPTNVHGSRACTFCKTNQACVGCPDGSQRWRIWADYFPQIGSNAYCWWPRVAGSGPQEYDIVNEYASCCSCS